MHPRAGQPVGAVFHADQTHLAGLRLCLSDTSALIVLSDTVSRHLLCMRLKMRPTGSSGMTVGRTTTLSSALQLSLRLAL